MNTQNIQHLNHAQTALYQLELVQEMAKSYEDNTFPIQENAYLVDNFVKTMKEHLEAITVTK